MPRIDICAEADKLLAQLPYTTAFSHPEQWNKLPVISFYDMNTVGSFSTDNSEDIKTGRLVIDIWTKTPKQGGNIAAEVFELMEDADWWCELDRFADKTDGIYHRTMRFAKIFITEREEF